MSHFCSASVRTSLRLGACVTAVVALTFTLGASAGAERLRPFSVDDFLNVERIFSDEVVVSNDGERVAYVRCLPIGAHPRAQVPCGHYGTTVWVAGTSGENAIKLVAGEGESLGRPVWSPDGEHLAVLSTKVRVSLETASDERSVWLWERTGGKMRKVAANVASWEDMLGGSPFVWVNNRTLFVATRTADAPSATGTADIAPGQWLNALRGTQATALVLDSGGQAKVDSPRVFAAFVDVSGKATSVKETSARAIGQLFPSPSDDAVAFVKPVPGPSLALQGDLREFHVGIGVRHQLCVVAQGMSRAVCAPRHVSVVGHSIRWLPSGKALAFAANDKADGPPRVWLATVMTDRLDARPIGDLEPTFLLTAENDQVLVKAKRVLRPNADQVAGRTDWWLCSAERPPVNLTERLANPPPELVATFNRRAFVGVADGAVWRLDLHSKEWSNLSEHGSPSIERIAWPRINGRTDPYQERAIVVSSEQNAKYYALDTERGRAEPLVKPSTEARLIGYSPQSRAVVFVDAGKNGTNMSVRRGDTSHTIVKLNEFLRHVAEGELRQIDYRSSDGEALKAWLILPPQYEAGRAYPLVTWVYHGTSASTDMARITSASMLNLQLFASLGYAVLIPSMPAGDRQPHDPYLELPKGVLTAIDKVIDLGIADPNRLALVGASMGGYSVYGLLTQTNRFRAAISLAGPSDLLSAYGSYSGTVRYLDNAHEDMTMATVIENGQIGMGGVPWRDAWRYLRNSPLFYADRVRSPLLIIQGDLDYVPISQGEEFFTALYRQGKRARFIRYAGEGHVILSSANIRDLWEQMTRWLADCFVSPESTATAAK